jgi:hypothetical protein
MFHAAIGQADSLTGVSNITLHATLGTPSLFTTAEISLHRPICRVYWGIHLSRDAEGIQYTSLSETPKNSRKSI